MQKIRSTLRPSILVALTLFIALAGGLILLMSNSTAPSLPPVAQTIPDPTPVPTPPPPTAPAQATRAQDADENGTTRDNLAGSSAEGAVETDGAPRSSPTVEIGNPETVAIVNGQVIQRADVERVRRMDTFMAEWLRRPPPGATFEIVSQMINGLLVQQAATAAGISTPQTEPESQLLSLLGVATASDPELVAALDIAHLDYESVLLYVSELLRVADQSRRLAQQQGVGVPDVLRNLQTQARISFGGGAQSEAQIAPPPATTADASPSATAEAMTLSLTRLDNLAGEMSQADATATAVTKTQAVTLEPVDDTPAVPPAATAQPDLQEPPRSRGIHAGNYAPLFDLPTIDAALPKIRLEDLEGDPVLLSFWTTWCPYCRAQTPTLNDAYAHYSGLGIRFVGINVRESREQVETYVAANDVPFLNALDANGVAATAYQIQGFPTTYFLDSRGHIFARHIGRLSEEQVDNYLTRLLDHQASLLE